MLFYDKKTSFVTTWPFYNHFTLDLLCMSLSLLSFNALNSPRVTSCRSLAMMFCRCWCNFIWLPSRYLFASNSLLMYPLNYLCFNFCAFVPFSSLNAIWSYRIWPLFWSSEENGVKSFCSFQTLVMLTVSSSSFTYFDFILKILHGSVWFACRLKTHWTGQWWEMVLSPLIRYCSMEHPDFVLGFGHKLWPLVVTLFFSETFSEEILRNEGLGFLGSEVINQQIQKVLK